MIGRYKGKLADMVRGSAVIVIAFVSGTGVAAAQSEPPKPVDPASWGLASDSPDDALADRKEGIVGFMLTIDREGRVTDCALTATSAVASLDTRTCILLRERARFSPTDTTGRAERGFGSRIRWQLPSAAATPAPIELPDMATTSVGAAVIYVGADGIVTRCDTVPKPYDNQLPPPSLCNAYPPGLRYSPPTLRNGKPVKRKVRIDLSTSDTYLR